MTTPQTLPAEHLIQLAQLDRAEFKARTRYSATHRRVADIPEGEATDQDLDDVTDTYMAWVTAWERLQQARRELGTVA